VWYPSKEAFERLTGGLTEEDAANSPGEE